MKKQLFLITGTLLAIFLSMHLASAYSYFAPTNYHFNIPSSSYVKTYDKSVRYYPNGYDKTIIISKNERPVYAYPPYEIYYGDYWRTKPYYSHAYPTKSHYYHHNNAHKDHPQNYYYKPYYNPYKSHYDWRW